jgi:hypothetical protein
MAERAVVAAVILLIVMSLCVYMTESFIPIGKNLDFRDICRSYLMKMEYCSGLSQSDCMDLESALENLGFGDITVSAPASAKAGTVMHLLVAAELTRDGFSGIFQRKEKTYEMSYSRKAIARKVVNR